jgi:hypothetical protein
MSMFNTFAQTPDHPSRTEKTWRKLERMKKNLRHEEPDRVPISDFFWGSFLDHWRHELGLPAWDDNARLVKVGKVRVHFELNLVAAGKAFPQELRSRGPSSKRIGTSR